MRWSMGIGPVRVYGGSRRRRRPKRHLTPAQKASNAKAFAILMPILAGVILILRLIEAASDSSGSTDTAPTPDDNYAYAAPTFDYSTATTATDIPDTTDAPTTVEPTTTTTTVIFAAAPTFDANTACATVNSGSIDIPPSFFPAPSLESALTVECESHPAETVGAAMNKLQAVKLSDYSTCQKATDSIAVGNNYIVDEYLASKVTAGTDPQGYWVAFETECFNNPGEAVGRAFTKAQSGG